MIIELVGLEKISLNGWYAGMHWTKRKQIKDKYTKIVKQQFKEVLSKSNQYEVSYKFEFKKNPLDASNCVAMVKMIEDIIFEDDKWNIVTMISMQSIKSIQDKITITVHQVI
jgi:hypothetical protein